MLPINLTVLTTSYPITPGSSSGIFVARLVENLPKNIARRVIVPASSASNPVAVSNSDGQIVLLPFRYAPQSLQILAHGPGGIPVALKKHKWSYLLVPSFLVAMFISCLRRGRKSDIIHANWAICGFVGGLAGYLARIPTVTTLRGEDISRARRSWLDKIILTSSMKFSTRVVTVSQAIASWLLDLYPQYKDKICLIENGVSDTFLSIKEPLEIEHNHQPIKLLFIGSLIQRKGIDQTIKALAQLNDRERIQFTIVGTGPEEQALKQLAEQCGLVKHLVFLGAVAPDMVPTLLRDADIVILASHSEGRPNVILEAMAAARPVIATDIEGVNELVVHGRTGLLFKDGDIKQLAAHITTLIEHNELRLNYGVAARNYILSRGLLWSNTAQKYAKIYHELIKDNKTCAE